LAPIALRNLAASWLSREVLLVLAFAGAVALTILLNLMAITSGLVIMEAAACLLGGAALFAMTRAYLLKTVPVWNSPATPLAFAGSALLLGGALGVVLTTFTATEPPALSPALVAAGISIVVGLLLGLAAISAAVTAEQATQGQTWYEPAKEPLSTAQTLALRMGLNLAGLGALAAIGGSGPAWMWSCLAFACLAAGEVLGRWRFYVAYRRVGL
jgi:DMSO reductase anchor subunit